MTSSLQDPEGTVVGGDFRLLRRLGAGGMGVVYLAEQLSTSKRRAVKVLRSTLVDDPKQRERFVREAKATAAIDSAHVVEVISAGVGEGGVPWLAMELLEGEDLASYLDKHQRLPLARMLSLFEQLCHALDAAHEAGIVHRDIKPENVFLAVTRRVGGELMVKVLDFGIAKILDATKTGGTAALGSPLWMAPEQTNPDVPISPATDVWALGLLAYWLLTGESYWNSGESDSGNIHVMLREVLFDPLPRATQRLAARDGDPTWLPADFDDWFERCVHREPRARFKTAAEAYAALLALGDGESEPLTASEADRFAASVDGLAQPSADLDALSTAEYLDLQHGDTEVLVPETASGAAPTLAKVPAAEPEPESDQAEEPAAVAASTQENNTVAALVAPQRLPMRLPWVLSTAAFLLVALVAGGWAMLRVKPSVPPPPEPTDARQDVEPTVATVPSPSPSFSASPGPRVTATAAPSALAPTAVPPSPPPQPVVTERSPPVQPSAVPTGSATVATSASASAQRPPFNAAAAQAAVNHRARTASFMCKQRSGPRAFAGTLLFGPNGKVIKVQLPPREGRTPSGLCVRTHMIGVSVTPFTGEPRVVSFAIALPS